MLEVRLGIDPSETQKYTTTLLSIHGLLTVLVAPVVAHFADKTPNRKVPLLMALTLCLVGTILVAWTPSVWALFLGRYLQAVGGSATWIVCFAILLDCTAAENLGKITGITMTFVTAGIISGPTVAGVLLELFGYWATWSVPMIILVLDIIAPLLMIQTRDLPSTSTKTDTPSPLNGDETITDETTALLSDNTSPPPKPDAVDPVDRDTPSPRKGFHRIILSDVRVLVGLSNTLLYSSIISGFDSTLPLHLRDIFGWGSMATGLTFFCLQLPSFFLAALSGMLRDRCGVRYPAAIGWGLMGPLLWLLGMPGDKSFPWAGAEAGGKTIFPCTLFVFGAVSMLVRGSGSLQLNLVVKDMQSKDPLIFGPGGGNARVHSILEMAFSTGMMLGPFLSGVLTEKVGYYYMTFTFGCISLLLSALCFRFLDGKRARGATSPA
ncbi:putative MFS transporter [Aspergillus tanneri]|uniref:Major facilitator superfamily (MFS) profile domain-containing protein n=1 Tax=Aspergillus tanneri TaxID=1220188 RepID=A0A5M9M8I5_9EURO|nr:uncharacterized protein ATNIH1004_010134 [Aspergillus tanneri]KAA8643365.1 hypothetical protein ATNIH1004_010134 [Aspergillus tanneri]